MRTDLVLVENVALFRSGVAALLTQQGYHVREAPDLKTAKRLVAERVPDTVICDARLRPCGFDPQPLNGSRTNVGIRFAVELRQAFPEVPVLLLSHHIAVAGLQALVDQPGHAGLGYLIKQRIGGIAEFCEVLTRVQAGELMLDPLVVERLVNARQGHPELAELTSRELEILSLMAEGLSNAAISERCYLSERTVESHVRSIFGKLDLAPETTQHRRVAAVLRLLETELP